MYNKENFYNIICEHKDLDKYKTTVLSQYDSSLESYYEEYGTEYFVGDIMNYDFYTPIHLEELIVKSRLNISKELVKEIIIATFIMHGHDRYEKELPISIYSF